VLDEEGPVVYIRKGLGVARSLGYMRIAWDEKEHAKVGNTVCLNLSNGQNNCDALGYIKHFGSRFENDLGLPVNAAASITGLTGGFGWLLTFLVGAPKKLEIKSTEIYPDSPLILGIPYPEGTQVTITATISPCRNLPDGYTCSETYHEVNSPEAVRSSQGNAYHMDSKGFLTVRVIMLGRKFIGTEDHGFTIPTIDTTFYDGSYALDRFERDGIVLLRKSNNPVITIDADCGVRGNGKESYCRGTPTEYQPSACQEGFEQVSYDKCCDRNDLSSCEYA
jgi:hypothetical protein